MASTGNGKRNTGRPSGSGRPRSAGSSSGRRPSQAPGRKKVPPKEITPWDRFHASRFFRPAMTVGIITVLVLLDLLLSWNNYNRFFIILGIELIIAAVIWVIALGFNLGADLESSGDNGDGA